MQRVFCVRFSGDGSYVFSGSDDMNVRVWKAEASEQLGVTLSREKHKQAYNKALVNRYKHMPEVRKVVKRRNLPAAIHKVRTAGAEAGDGSGLGAGLVAVAFGVDRELLMCVVCVEVAQHGRVEPWFVRHVLCMPGYSRLPALQPVGIGSFGGLMTRYVCAGC
jgi:hypothetical protein